MKSNDGAMKRVLNLALVVLLAAGIVGLLLVGCLSRGGERPAGPEMVGMTTPNWTNYTNLGVATSVAVGGDLTVTGVTVNGPGKFVAPTAGATATPALVVDSLAAASNILEVRDAATPVFTINNGGAFTATGAGTYSSGQTINAWAKVAGPTAVGTATPALVVDTTGVSNIFEARKAATPMVSISGAGNTTIAGTLDVTGAATFSGAITAPKDTAHFGLPSVISTTVVYSAASGTVATIGAGEVWFIHAVYAKVNTNFDCTGDNCTLQIGDGNDANGLLDLVDAELQAADTEGTGAPAGWQGFMSTDTIGAYLAQGLGFVYAGAETIDWAVGGTSPAAGSADIYVVYTRVY